MDGLGRQVGDTKNDPVKVFWLAQWKTTQCVFCVPHLPGKPSEAAGWLTPGTLAGGVMVLAAIVHAERAGYSK